MKNGIRRYEKSDRIYGAPSEEQMCVSLMFERD